MLAPLEEVSRHIPEKADGHSLKWDLESPIRPFYLHREDYVVEFTGPDDPMHAQNWPMKKKYVNCPRMIVITD